MQGPSLTAWADKERDTRTREHEPGPDREPRGKGRPRRHTTGRAPGPAAADNTRRTDKGHTDEETTKWHSPIVTGDPVWPNLALLGVTAPLIL